MVNNAKTKAKRGHSIPSGSVGKAGSPFRRLHGRGFQWSYAALAVLCLGPVSCYLLDKFQSGPWAAGLGIGLTVLFLGMMVYANHLITKDRAAFIASTLASPEEKDLRTYIAAFVQADSNVQDQAAQIVCELLGRFSEEQLACIPDEYWSQLCPLPQYTPSGYSDAKTVARNDQVHVAVFTAIMRMKRMKSLPYIESWMEHLNVTRHSGAFVRTLHDCYEALLNHQATLHQSSTLLRPSSAETAATPDVLLRPVMGTHLSETETGEQLLRASQGQDKGIDD